MPRYFFNVYDGRVIPDLDGRELPDLDAVRVEAVQTAGELLRDGARHWTGEEWVMIVADQTGGPVMTLSFSAKVTSHVAGGEVLLRSGRA